MRRLLSLPLLLLAITVQARVISYSPYTDRSAVPAHQHRMNRHFVLVEGSAGAMGGGGAVMPPVPAPGIATSQARLSFAPAAHDAGAIVQLSKPGLGT